MSAAAAADWGGMRGAASAAPLLPGTASDRWFKVKVCSSQIEPGSTQMRRLVGIALSIALFAGSSAVTLANPAPPASARSEDSVKALALQWFAQMEACQ